MVQSPVGARCPECSRIGRSAMFNVSGVDFGRAFSAGLVAAAGMSVALLAFLWILEQLPVRLLLSVIAGMLAVGYVVGEAVRRGSGYKIDKRLPYLAAVLTFASYLVATVVSAVWMNNAMLGGLWGLLGLGLGVFVAMGRVRP
jgi:hypothetical protein